MLLGLRLYDGREAMSKKRGSAATASGAAMVAIAGRAGKLKPEQQQFNRLSAQLQSKREELRAWVAFQDRFDQRMEQEYLPLMHVMTEERKRFARAINEVLALPAKVLHLSRKRRDGVRGYLVDMLDALLDVGPDAEPDAEMLAMHDFHSPVSYADKQQVRQQNDAALEDWLDVSMEDGDWGAPPWERAQTQPHADVDGEDAAAAGANHDYAGAEGAHRRARAASERQRKAEQDMRLSLREVYRKLASELHPDREADSVERSRKTELMQRVNLAYKAGDLLTLLTLQIEIEQINGSDLAALPQSLVKRYNQVLRGQLTAIDRELADQCVRYEEILQSRVRLSQPAQVDRGLSQMLSEMRQAITMVGADCAALRDPARRMRIVDTLVQVQSDAVVDERDLGFQELFDELADAVMHAAPGNRRRRAKRSR